MGTIAIRILTKEQGEAVKAKVSDFIASSNISYMISNSHSYNVTNNELCLEYNKETNKVIGWCYED